MQAEGLGGMAGNSRDSAATHVTIIESRDRKLLDIKELLQYRDLFYFLVWRDIKIRYKQTVLGFAWALIQPLFSMVLFTLVFNKMAKVPSDGTPYPIFSYLALVPFTYFQNALNQSSISLVGNAMISKVYFPRITIPMAPILAYLVDFCIAFSILGIFLVYYQIVPSWQVVYLPLLMLMLLMFTSGLGMWLSAMAIQYRDIKLAMTFITQLLTYASPVVWSASLIPDSIRPFYALYPMAGVIEGFRAAVIGKPMPWDLIGIGFIGALIIWISGLFYFRARERVFADIF